MIRSIAQTVACSAVAACLALAATCSGAAAADDPALVKAATDGDVAAVERLLAAGTDPDSHDDNGLTALNWAAYQGHVAVVKALLAKHAAVDSHGNPRGWTPLMNATNGGHDEVISLLLAAGAAVNATDTDGTQAIWYAAIRHQAKVVTLLRASGASGDISGLVKAQALCAAGTKPMAEQSLEWHADGPNHGACSAVKHDSPRSVGAIIMVTYVVEGDRKAAKALSIRVQIYDDHLPKETVNATVQPLLRNIFAAAGRGAVPPAVTKATASLADLQADTPLGTVTARLTLSTKGGMPANGAEYRIAVQLK